MSLVKLLRHVSISSERLTFFIVRFLTTWLSISSLTLTYTISTVACATWREGLANDKLKRFLTSIISFITFLASFLLLMVKRKRLREVTLEIVELVKVTDGRIASRLRRYVTIAAFLALAYTGYLLTITLYVNAARYEFVYHNVEENHLCYGCNWTTWNYDVYRVFLATMIVVQMPALTGISFPQVLLYCYLTQALADVLKIQLQLLTVPSKNGRRKLKSFRQRLTYLKSLVDRVNFLFRNILLMWFGSTLFITCKNIASFSMSLNRNHLFTEAFYSFWTVYLLDFILLVSLTVVASRLNEQSGRIGESVSLLSEPILSQGGAGFQELVVFQGELASLQQLGFQAGSCFVITKKLLLSFLGLGVTYTVLFVQFNPTPN